MNPDHAPDPLAEGRRYAQWLEWGTRLGLGLLVAAFAAYVFGWVTPHVPLDTLPSLWGLNATTYLQRTGTPTGWGWLALLHRADVANLAGIAVLAGCSLPPLLALVPLYLRQNNRVYAALCVSVALVLLLAASGLLAAGH